MKRVSLRKLALALALGGALAGCASVDPRRQVVDETAALRTGPQQAPQQTITGFSPALRCMDNLFYAYGIRDIPVLVEELTDQTKKVNAGTKDILISAVSQMTVRSRAVRLVVYGQDSGNLVGFLRESQRRHPYAVLPEYDIKGSISQLDENLVRRQADAGFSFGTYFSAGASRTGGTNVLAVDLTMLSAHNLSVVPGVTSRNSVVILKDGTGVDGEAQIKKFGINFNMSLARSEGQAQALRTLIELAAIELLGKLTRTPYWTCLGETVNAEAVKTEIADFFFGLLADPSDLVRWFQNQLRVRGLYRGPVDGVANPELADAVAAYREKLGLAKNYKVNLEFFSAYLRARHPEPVATIVPVAQAAAPLAGNAPATPAVAPAGNTTAAAPAPAGPASEQPVRVAATSSAPAQEAARKAAAPPLGLTVASTNGTRTFKRGDVIGLTVVASRDAHVYCYLQDEKRQVIRFYPNRFQGDSSVKAGALLALPGTMRFRLFANEQGKDETVACFAAERDVIALVPAAVGGDDLKPLAVASLDAVKAAFRDATRNTFAEGYFYVQVR